MLNIKEYLNIYIIGGILYGAIETFWRGYTHWTMILTGGLCMLLVYVFNKRYKNAWLIVKCIVAAIIITAIEFLVGCIVNIGLGWNVWDYSNEHFNIMGQICVRLSITWLLLSVPMIMVCNIYEKIFNRIQTKIMQITVK